MPVESKITARMKLLAALACAAALAIAGCGEKEDVLEPTGSKHVELMLDYFPNADHAGMVPLVLPDVFTFFDQVK